MAAAPPCASKTIPKVYGKGKGRASAKLTIPLSEHWTTTKPYDSGIPNYEERNKKPLTEVITPWFKSVCELKDNGHPDLSQMKDPEPMPSSSGKKSVKYFGKYERDEDVSDDRFLKRHLPMEISERKRKKWNSHATKFDFEQELRKKKQEEKAKAHLSQYTTVTPAVTAPPTPEKPFSFWPDISQDHSKTIVVGDTLPVVAFGTLVPRFDKRIVFSLPSTGVNAIILKVDIPRTSMKSRSPTSTTPTPTPTTTTTTTTTPTITTGTATATSSTTTPPSATRTTRPRRKITEKNLDIL